MYLGAESVVELFSQESAFGICVKCNKIIFSNFWLLDIVYDSYWNHFCSCLEHPKLRPLQSHQHYSVLLSVAQRCSALLSCSVLLSIAQCCSAISALLRITQHRSALFRITKSALLRITQRRSALLRITKSALFSVAQKNYPCNSNSLNYLLRTEGSSLLFKTKE